MSTARTLALASDPDEGAYSAVGIEDPALGRLAHVALSRVLGRKLRGALISTRPLLVTLAGIGRLDYRTPHGAVEQAPTPDLSDTGWVDGATALRRLGLSAADLDRIWETARASDGLHAVLPLDVVVEFFPPEVWPVVARVIEWGPGATCDRLERFARLEALRKIKPTRSRPLGGTLSSGTIDNMLVGGRGLMKTLVDLGSLGYPSDLLTSWVALPPFVSATELGAQPAETDRSAPPLSLVRRALRAVQCEIERRMLTQSGRRSLARLLRRRLLIALLVVTGARIAALSRVRVCDYERNHQFLDRDVVGPALCLYPGKTLPRGASRWKALPIEVADWLEETIAYFGLRPEETLWRSDKSGQGMTTSSLADLVAGAFASTDLSVPLTAPGQGGKPMARYSPHTVRHLSEQLAFLAGYDYLAEHQDAMVAISPQVLSDALLDHAMGDDRLGYKDLASVEGRERWARTASLRIWEYVWGDRGARHVPDRDAIERAVGRRDELRAEQEAVETRINDLRLERRNIERHGGKGEELPVEELVRLLFRLSAVAGALDDEHQEAEDVQRRLHAAEQALQEAQTTLVAIPDDAPDPEPTEPQVDELAGEEAPQPVRDWLTVRESAHAFSVSEQTMRRWLRGTLSHAEGDPRNPWQPSETDQVVEQHSQRKRRLVISRLDRSRIAPEVMRVINEMLLHPPR